MGRSVSGAAASCSPLERHFGLLNAVALNVTMIIGLGVFVTIPLMLKALPGPYALLGWLVAGLLMLVDGLVWSELGAALPGSGGSYRYLLESFGAHRWGRLMAFLFIWQFLISGPLEIATGFIAIGQVSNSFPGFAEFNEAWTIRLDLGEWAESKMAASFGPTQLGSALLILLMVVLLYRRITSLGKLTMTFWIGVLAASAWILLEGWGRFDPAVAFDLPGSADGPINWGEGLGATMMLAMFAYLGYYHSSYIGDELRDPARTIPRSILLSALLVCGLFVGLHLAMLGTVPWRDAVNSKNLPADFMGHFHGNWARILITLSLIWSSLGSCFATLLGYSRIPYGAARYGHFFSVLGRVHPVHHFPHLSLLLVAGLTFFWCFFDLGDVINALITTRILGQFVAQILGLMILRRQPGRTMPFRMWLYPLPCGLALAGWLFVFGTSAKPFILFSLFILGWGGIAFLSWAGTIGGWPFGSPSSGEVEGAEESPENGNSDGIDQPELPAQYENT